MNLIVQTSDPSPDQLLAAFLDACRDKNLNAARDAISKLRSRVWAGSPLPRDVRPDLAQQAELRRLSTLWRGRQQRRAKETPARPE